MNISSVSAAARTYAPNDAALTNQNEDTTKTLEPYGYKREGTFQSAVNKFTFTPQVIVNVLDTRFNPRSMKTPQDRESTKNIKLFIQQIVTKTLNMFEGDSPEARKANFIRALESQKDGTVEISVNGVDINFNKELAPTEAMSTAAAQKLFGKLSPGQAALFSPARVAAPPERHLDAAESPPASVTSSVHLDLNAENLIHHFIDRFKDGVKEYTAEDKDYGDIQEITEADLNKAHERPDFKTFLRYLKSLGIVPLNPKAFRTLFLPEAAAVHERAEERVEGARGLFDDDD